MKSYERIQVKYIDEIKSNITIYRHKKTNARICTIENDDNNKVFSIAFRTPPKDNTGLTHILEHSVLCGSKKYPVKDPFVELLKGSLNTFLNAFTFPDKTMYPCASQNDKDFKNLMSVYMDAVFYPQIYKHEEIFMQEGWHYHILDKNQDITYNGVVYNEMKGAFSDPQQLLIRTIMKHLYKDTPYSYESGGFPEEIPNLKYEDFIEFHSKYYHPSNAYIFIYGNCDMEERLCWLDKEYLANFSKDDFDTKIPYQKNFTKVEYIDEFYPLSENEKTDNKAILSYALALPTTLDNKLITAMNMLLNVLFNAEGAPIKEALLNSKITPVVSAFIDDAMLQPLLVIKAIDCDENRKNEFIEIIESELKQVVKKGVDKSSIEALINYKEFKVREGKYGYMPKGLGIIMDCLSSWLYDENAIFNKFTILDVLDELRNELKGDYFESIIEEYILNNKHKVFVNLMPSHSLSYEKERKQNEKLKRYKKMLSESDLEKLIEKNIKLQKYQSEETSEEAKATLPKLTISDLSMVPEKYKCEELFYNDIRVLFSDYFTNKINYISYCFSIDDLSIIEIQYLELFADLLGKLSTDKRTYKQIVKDTRNYTGEISFTINTLTKIDGTSHTEFKISYSALDKYMNLANDLVLDVLFNSDFNDEKRILERIKQMKVSLEKGLANNGHIVGLQRALSYFEASSLISDSINGIGYLDFLTVIYKDFNLNVIKDKIFEIVSKTLSKKRFSACVVCEKESLYKNYEYIDYAYEKLNDKNQGGINKYDFKVLNEGFKTKSNINYVAKVGKYKSEYNGAMIVLSNALNLDYLWNRVRVQGGAYGCMLMCPITKTIGLVSYRDPQIKKTLEVYDEIVNYISEFNPSDEQLLQYKIGAIGGLDYVLHPSTKGYKAQQEYIQGCSYELQVKYRKEALMATKEDIRKLKDCFLEALKENIILVIGNDMEIEKNKEIFKNIRNITKGDN